MLDISQLIVRFGVALLLGSIIGVERELSHKEAGLRTTILVSCGAALFTLIALQLPYLVAVSPQNIGDTIARNSGFLNIIANIVVGIGFLGAGIIIKTGKHVHGLTTAAMMWFAAAIGTLSGLGLFLFSTVATLSIMLVIYLSQQAQFKDSPRRSRRRQPPVV